MWIEGSIPSFSYSYIIHYITTILYSTPHIHKLTHIYSPDPNKNHITISLYNISVSILHSLLQKPKLYLHLLLPYSLLLLTKYIYTILPITHHYYYIYTNLQSKYTTILDRYISYIHNYYLLTYTENRTHLSIHLFHHTIVWIHISLLSYSIYYTLPLLLYHYYFIITTSSLLLYHIVNIPYVYVHTYIHTIIHTIIHNHTYNHTQSYIQSLVLITTHIFI